MTKPASSIGGRRVLHTDGPWVVLEGGGRCHVRAWVGDGVWIGNRARIGDGVWIGNRTWIGDGAWVGSRTWIGDGVTVGDHARVGDGVWIGDHAGVGDGVWIGNRVRIGDGAWIPASSVVAIVGPLGTRRAFLSLYPIEGGGHEYVTGCFRGTFAALEAASRATHGLDSAHYRAYGATAAALWRIVMGSQPLPTVGGGKGVGK